MKENVKKFPELSGCTYDIGNIRKGNKDKIVEKTMFDNKEGDLGYAIETIHGCKGMSLDSVLFVSSYTNLQVVQVLTGVIGFSITKLV
mgnify:CR=1 FL=1